MFADDTTILYSHKELSSKINVVNVVNEELEEVSNWFEANKLSVNASKTSFMILGTPKITSTKTHQDFNITLNDTSLERVKFTKFLGVLINGCLTWKKHIDCISKTISTNICIMNKLKYAIPGRILKTLYFTLIQPYLSYEILIWRSTCKSYLDELQKWEIHTVCNSQYKGHTVLDLYLQNVIL